MVGEFGVVHILRNSKGFAEKWNWRTLILKIINWIQMKLHFISNQTFYILSNSTIHKEPLKKKLQFILSTFVVMWYWLLSLYKKICMINSVDNIYRKMIILLDYKSGAFLTFGTNWEIITKMREFLTFCLGVFRKTKN